MASFFKKISTFRHKHPIITHLFYILLASVILIWLIGVVFLNWLTRHGEEVEMPLVQNLPIEQASKILTDGGFDVEIDSIYNDGSQPGIVIEQVPREHSMVKDGGTVYLLYTCYNIRKAKVPTFIDKPLDEARANFQERGFRHISIKEVPAEYPGAVVGALYNGVKLSAGQEIPINAQITLQVGMAFPEEIILPINDSIIPEMHQEDYDEILLNEAGF